MLPVASDLVETLCEKPQHFFRLREERVVGLNTKLAHKPMGTCNDESGQTILLSSDLLLISPSIRQWFSTFFGLLAHTST